MRDARIIYVRFPLIPAFSPGEKGKLYRDSETRSPELNPAFDESEPPYVGCYRDSL